MKNLKFKSAAAQNFLPFGPEGIKIDFESLGNIILIKGENIDYKEASTKESSNGSGKSSIQEIIIWTLYGKTIKNPKKLNKNDVIHNIYKKGCKTEVVFDKYKIQRGRSPDYLKLWELDGENWVEYTQGKSQDTQQRIEEIVGLSYESFLSTSVFTDDQVNCFLEATIPEKREIIEDLLSLSVYKQRFENSKAILKENKTGLKQLSNEYELILNNNKSIENKIESSIQTEKKWKLDRQNEIKNIIYKIKEKEKVLENLNDDEELKNYQASKSKSVEVNKKIETESLEFKKISEQKNNLKTDIDHIVKKINSNKENIKNLEFDKRVKTTEIEKNNKEIVLLKNNKTGQVCKNCYGEINPDNYKDVIKKYEKSNESIQFELDKIVKDILDLDYSKESESLKEKETYFKDICKKEKDLESSISKLRSEFIKLSSIKEPESNNSKNVIEKEIELMKEEAKKYKEIYENSPYKDMISELKNDLDKSKDNLEKKQKSIKDIEKHIPYYEFWTEAFGDSGIRKWVVDSIIPALNSRLDYWMQVLDDNRIKIEFNNELEETIHKNLEENIEFFYYTMSAGQKRRLNLAVSQSFAHIMMLVNNTCPSLCFLDEVTTNIDPVGVQGIYNMICELSEQRQIFITTHDIDLLNMLSGCDTIKLKMENGISKLEVDKIKVAD
jgi:DNA repair exonuclease SbcCD ATPase subunit